MLDAIDNTLDKSQNSFIHDAVAGTALELASFYMNLEYIADKMDIENLEGTDLEDYIYQRTGLKRKQATFANGLVEFTGTEGTVIEKGLLVSNDNIDYEVVEPSIIDALGKATVKVQAITRGSVGNAPTGAINAIAVEVGGLDTVNNPNPITNGYNEEDDDTYLARYYERVRTPATSGNKFHYLLWAKEVVGVGDARVIPLWDGAGTVKVFIIDSNKVPADEELASEVLEYINEQKPIGAEVTVESAVEKSITLTADIDLADGYIIGDVQSEFEEVLEEYRKSIAFKDSYVGYSAIGSLLFNVKGVIDYSNLKLNGGVLNVATTESEVAMFDVSLGVV